MSKLAQPEADAERTIASVQKPATILVVDDHAPSRQFLISLLTYKGHHLLEASDGAEALARVRVERPDLVLSDILMPTMDGYEFVRHLRMDGQMPEMDGFCCYEASRAGQPPLSRVPRPLRNMPADHRLRSVKD